MQSRRAAGPTKITPYADTLRQALEADAHRPRRERRTARKLYAQLQAQGFSGSYGRVTECIRAWRAAQGAVSARSAYVPLRCAWGEAFQFDWSEEGLVLGGVWRKVQLAYLPLIERKPAALRNGAPFADLPDSLQRLRRALLRHAGGDNVMARVLMAVPTHGVDAVLVAVDLVLESGRPSADHVLNVIARLTDGPAVATVATMLTVETAPLAAPQRYDTLHAHEEATHG